MKIAKQGATRQAQKMQTNDVRVRIGGENSSRKCPGLTDSPARSSAVK